MAATLMKAVQDGIRIWSHWRLAISNILLIGMFVYLNMILGRLIANEMARSPQLGAFLLIAGSIGVQLVYVLLTMLIGYFNFQVSREKDFDFLDLIVSMIFFTIYLVVIGVFAFGIFWITSYVFGWRGALVAGGVAAVLFLLLTLGGVARMVYAGNDYGRILGRFIAIFSPKRIWNEALKIEYWKKVGLYLLFALGLWLIVFLIEFGFMSIGMQIRDAIWFLEVVKAVIDVTYYAALFFGLVIFIDKEEL